MPNLSQLIPKRYTYVNLRRWGRTIATVMLDDFDEGCHYAIIESCSISLPFGESHGILLLNLKVELNTVESQNGEFKYAKIFYCIFANSTKELTHLLRRYQEAYQEDISDFDFQWLKGKKVEIYIHFNYQKSETLRNIEIIRFIPENLQYIGGERND